MPHYDCRRELAIPAQQAHQLILAGLPNIKDVEVTNPGNPIAIDRKRRLTANRYAMNGTIKFEGDQLHISLDGMGSMHKKFAEEILALLPDGSILDYGIGEALANADKSAKFFGALEISNLIDDMQPQERVIMITSGILDKSSAIIVLTNQRILIKDRTAFSASAKEIRPSSISSISTSSKMTGEALKLTVSGADLEISTMPHGRGTELANLIRKELDNPPTKKSSEPSNTSADPLEQVQKLAELHAAGVLSDEEFTAAKRKALGI